MFVVKIGEGEVIKTMCGIPDKKPFRHFPMPLGGATGAIPLKIFQGKSFLARRPLVMFRPNRSVKPIGF